MGDRRALNSKRTSRVAKRKHVNPGCNRRTNAAKTTISVVATAHRRFFATCPMCSTICSDEASITDLGSSGHAALRLDRQPVQHEQSPEIHNSMSFDTFVQQPPSQNPFRASRKYSDSSVELMRGMSAFRKESGRDQSTPTELLKVIADLGYHQPDTNTLPAALEARRFVQVMSAHQQQENIGFPTADDVLTVLNQIGYGRLIEDTGTVLSGMQIDRRRREEDARREQLERRDSAEPSAQELLNLTEEEHLFLDALKSLRKKTGRQFTASEELLSIAWELGYRPVGSDGVPLSQLDHTQRCQTQVSFTRTVEQCLAETQDSAFLTCRTVFEILAALGFQKVS